MNKSEQLAALEAILFAAGEPFLLSKLAESLKITTDEAEILVDLLKNNIDQRAGGLILLRLEDRVQLCTRPEFSELVRTALEKSRNTPLSPAAFEVLAIVAYHQPVTKSYVEQVRGVDCHHIISSLCQKNLLEETGRLDLPGKPITYGTTDDFLKNFSISSLEDLPKIPENKI